MSQGWWNLDAACFEGAIQMQLSVCLSACLLACLPVCLYFFLNQCHNHSKHEAFSLLLKSILQTVKGTAHLIIKGPDFFFLGGGGGGGGGVVCLSFCIVSVFSVSEMYVCCLYLMTIHTIFRTTDHDRRPSSSSFARSQADGHRPRASPHPELWQL